VETVLAQLSEAERESVVLAYFGGRTYHEVAEELRVPEGTAKRSLRDGLSALRHI
jgi:RNA polymerase sigma-70 factor (ECF subfamily)